MKKISLCLLSLYIVLLGAKALAAQRPAVTLTHKPEQEKVDVFIDGKYFCSYLYGHPLLNKPVLFPVLSSSGKTITRGYPIATRAGERIDHTHHYGIWFNHGDVNGIDFWNAGRTPPKPGVRYGKIHHKNITHLSSGTTGKLAVAMEWRNHKGEAILQQKTSYEFSGDAESRIISHRTELTSIQPKVTFTDSKEGLFGIRVARALELPSEKPAILTGKDLKPKPTAEINRQVSGHYRNSEGVEGYPAVWGKRARWMQLSGKLESTSLSILLFDAPANVNHPPHWMARDYGLFAVNSLGSAIYTEGKESLNYTLAKGETLTFAHQFIISEAPDLKANTIEKWYHDFAQQQK